MQLRKRIATFLLLASSIPATTYPSKVLPPDCPTGFKFAVDSKLIPDDRTKGIPLYKTENGFGGYEFLRSGPVFSNPNGVREFVNSSWPSAPKYNNQIERVEIDTGFLQIDFYDTSRTKVLTRLSKLLNGKMPESMISELSKYIESVIDDAELRNVKFRNLSFSIRTEQSAMNQMPGHSHEGAGGLSYARAEIGVNTELDSKDRTSPRGIKTADYISSAFQDQTIVFGDVWHRTPRRSLATPRLWIAVDLSP